MSADLEPKGPHVVVVKSGPKETLRIEIPAALVRFFDLRKGSKLEFFQNPMTSQICVGVIEEEAEEESDPNAPKRRGRKRQFTRAEINEMRSMYFSRTHPASAVHVARLFHTSQGTVLRAADGTLKAKDDPE
jgi:hypothetical protein